MGLSQSADRISRITTVLGMTTRTHEGIQPTQSRAGFACVAVGRPARPAVLGSTTDKSLVFPTAKAVAPLVA